MCVLPQSPTLDYHLFLTLGCKAKVRRELPFLKESKEPK